MAHLPADGKTASFTTCRERRKPRSQSRIYTTEPHLLGVCACMGLCSFIYTCVKKKEMTAVNGYLGEEI